MKIKQMTMEVKTGLITLDGVKFSNGVGEGNIVGYASTFGNVDRVGDRVMAGAFGERSFTVPYLAYHDKTLPIGNCLCTPDQHGLATNAVLANVPKAQEIRELAKIGAIPAQSIGYRVLASEPNEFGGEDLYKLDTAEVSAVPVPANPLALITAAKAFAADDEELDELVAKLATSLATKRSGKNPIQKAHDLLVKYGALCDGRASFEPGHKDLALEAALAELELG